MRPTDLEDRIKNYPRGAFTPSCASCGDDGMVEATYRREGGGLVAEMAPCPFCMRGYRLEFPEQRLGAWGPQGYWRGQEIPTELLRHASQDRPLAKAEQLAQVRKLAVKSIDEDAQTAATKEEA